MKIEGLFHAVKMSPNDWKLTSADIVIMDHIDSRAQRSALIEIVIHRCFKRSHNCHVLSSFTDLIGHVYCSI